ncbi:MAG TPA: heavy metal translocating P-type ATPase [Armatimonadota bacterium]
MRQLCDHCGLPCNPLLSRREGERVYCCLGCSLVARMVGAPATGGAVAGVLLRLGIGAFLAMNVMMISLLLYYGEVRQLGEHAETVFRWGLLGLSTPALVLLGYPFLIGAGRELRRGRANLDTLIALGAFSAYGVSAAHVLRGGAIYFDTATMLLLLVTLGRFLETSSRTSSARLVRGLLSLRPPLARVQRDGEEREIPAEEVQRSELVYVRPGERLPVDGVIVEGASCLREAEFTGESLPRTCGPGDAVTGGTLNGEGALRVRAMEVGEGSLLARIVRQVERANRERTPSERLAERVAAWFVPVVGALAGGTLLFWLGRGEEARALSSALAVLVVACPCALGLATPLVTSLAIGRAARTGVLIRSGEVLETLPLVRQFFLDKTGTLTRGELTLVRVELGDSGLSEPEALAALATLESGSEHPLGRAVVAEARRRGLVLGTVADYRAYPGEGASGRVNNGDLAGDFITGTAVFLRKRGLRVPPGEDAPGETRLWAGGDLATPVARPVVFATVWRDQVRAEAGEAVAGLRRRGCRVSVLTGDNEETGALVAREVGAEAVVAHCTPERKLLALREARRAGPVAMVGDGLNDAPALAAADVGIALGGGSDLSLETAGVALLGEDLSRLPWLLELAQAARTTIRQNLGWAFGYNSVALVLACLGYLHPLVAAGAMLGSSAFVLGNSLRLASFRGSSR